MTKLQELQTLLQIAQNISKDLRTSYDISDSFQRVAFKQQWAHLDELLRTIALSLESSKMTSEVSWSVPQKPDTPCDSEGESVTISPGLGQVGISFDPSILKLPDQSASWGFTTQSVKPSQLVDTDVGPKWVYSGSTTQTSSPSYTPNKTITPLRRLISQWESPMSSWELFRVEVASTYGTMVRSIKRWTRGLFGTR